MTYGKIFDFNVAEWRAPNAGDIECYKRLQSAYGALSLSMKILHDFSMKIVRDEIYAEPSAVASVISKSLAQFKEPKRDDDETAPEVTVCNEWLPEEGYGERAERIKHFRRNYCWKCDQNYYCREGDDPRCVYCGESA